MNETLIILDWDDTILPSSFISIMNDHNFIRDDIVKHEKYIMKIIKRLKFLSKCCGGNIIILSNAHKLWIDQTLNLYFTQEFRNILSDIEIVSARDIYQFIEWDSDMWKKNTLEKRIEHYPYLKHIISIGDAPNDYDSVLSYCKSHRNVPTFQFVHLITRPHVKDLIEEYKLILPHISSLFIRINRLLTVKYSLYKIEIDFSLF